VTISSDAELLRLLGELTRDKAEFDRLKEALDSVHSTGYGVVMPDQEEMTLQQPELLKKGGAFGVRLRSAAPSIHMVRVDVTTELTPMVGSEDQARDLLAQLSGEPEEVWDRTLFGKSVSDTVREGLNAKLMQTGPQVREKLRQSLSRIHNEGAQGLICIIL
jgi:stage IV sporulation protein A